MPVQLGPGEGRQGEVEEAGLSWLLLLLAFLGEGNYLVAQWVVVGEVAVLSLKLFDA
jgi:hypothetical protein